jgi:hypothetical protein
LRRLLNGTGHRRVGGIAGIHQHEAPLSGSTGLIFGCRKD